MRVYLCYRLRPKNRSDMEYESAYFRYLFAIRARHSRASSPGACIQRRGAGVPIPPRGRHHDMRDADMHGNTRTGPTQNE